MSMTAGFGHETLVLRRNAVYLRSEDALDLGHVAGARASRYSWRAAN